MRINEAKDFLMGSGFFANVKVEKAPDRIRISGTLSTKHTIKLVAIHNLYVYMDIYEPDGLLIEVLNFPIEGVMSMNDAVKVAINWLKEYFSADRTPGLP